MTLNVTEIKALLSQPEGPKLDFKSRLNIYHEDKEAQRRARDELIRDILAIANGNALVAGQTGYLIFGAADQVQEGQTRKLYSVEGRIPTRTDILDIVNSACSPRIEDIDVQAIEVDGQRLVVIVIPPTPHLHEVIKDLNTKDGKFYSAYSVFVRQNEQIRPASAKEREAILEAKRRFFSQKNYVNPVWISVILGAVMFGTWGFSSSANLFGLNLFARLLAMAIGGAMGALVGLGFGFGVEQYLKTKEEWTRYPRLLKVLIIGMVVLVFGGLMIYIFFVGS